jgi:hypothetical protein
VFSSRRLDGLREGMVDVVPWRSLRTRNGGGVLCTEKETDRETGVERGANSVRAHPMEVEDSRVRQY